MECPKCPKNELLPARTSEQDSRVDGWKCPKCDQLYRFNKSNHLIPINFGAPKLLTDDDIQPGITRDDFVTVLKKVTAPIKNETKVETKEVKPIPTAHHRLPVPVIQANGRRYHRLNDKERAELIRRIEAKDKPTAIAHDLNCDISHVYTYKRRLREGSLPKLNEGFYPRLGPKQQAEVKSRIAKGDKVPDIAKDMQVTPSAIYKYRRGITGRNTSDAAKMAENWLASDKCDSPSLKIRMANNGYIVTDMEGDEFAYTSLKDLLQVVTEFFGEPIPCNPTRETPK